PSMTTSPSPSSPPSSVTTLRVGSPAGTITHTIRGPSSGRAATSSARLATCVTSGRVSYPTTSIPAARMRARMLLPILPRPTSPMRVTMRVLRWGRACGYGAGDLGGSAREADRDEEVAVVGRVLAVERVLSGELDRLVRVREAQADEVRPQRAQAVQQELRVERHGDVLADQHGLERLGRLRVVTL